MVGLGAELGLTSDLGLDAYLGRPRPGCKIITLMFVRLGTESDGVQLHGSVNEEFSGRCWKIANNHLVVVVVVVAGNVVS